MKRIINADDFGYSHDVNRAIVDSFKQGIISSTTIMMNMPEADEAIKFAFENGFQDSVGLHFNIIEGVPLSEDIKKCHRICTNGVFTYKRNSVKRWTTFEKSAIAEEFEAQLSALINRGITPSHIDSHQHPHTEPAIFAIIYPIMRKAGVVKMRASRNLGISKIHIILKSFLNAYFRMKGIKMTRYFNDVVQKKINDSVDNIEIMCHPTYRNGAIVDAFRKIELKKEYNELINYRQL